VAGLVALLTLTWACHRGDEDGSESSESTENTASAPVVEPVSATLTVEAGGVVPGVTVQVELPGHWHAHDFFDAWLPGEDPFEAQLRVDVSCGGVCDASAMAANMEEAVTAPLEEQWRQGSDEPHFQPTIEVIDTGELPLGRYRAYRVSYPPAPEGEAAPRPGTHLDCYIHGEGDAFYVRLEASATPENESEIWPVLLDSCRGATYEVVE
jgi:hypothetical protein